MPRRKPKAAGTDHVVPDYAPSPNLPLRSNSKCGYIEAEVGPFAMDVFDIMPELSLADQERVFAFAKSLQAHRVTEEELNTLIG